MAAPSGPAPCGYFGKVPARADFVRARLHGDTVEPWDRWLQDALAHSQRRLGSAWQGLFFAAPIWRFILAPGACGRFALMGVLMPSIDAVGRCFPLMLAQEIDRPVDPLELIAASTRWFAAAETLALAALGDGFDLDHFDRPLPACDAPSRPTPRMAPPIGDIGAWMALPIAAARTAMAAAATLIADRGAASGIWWTAGAEVSPGLPPCLAVSDGLVPPRGFAALLDGCWQDHGWTGRNPPRDAATDENNDWERQGRWPNSI